MDRRAFVTRAGAFAAAALAGCLSNGPADGDAGGDAGEDANGTPTPTAVESPGTVDEPTATDEPTASDRPHTDEFSVAFEVRGVRAGSAENSAAVEFADGTVTVDGTIGGRNGCYTARLGEAALADDSLRVLVEAHEDRGDEEVCTQGLVDVDYVATFEFDGTSPGRVVVEHGSMDNVQTVADEHR